MLVASDFHFLRLPVIPMTISVKVSPGLRSQRAHATRFLGLQEEKLNNV